MDVDLLSLKWNNHRTTFLCVIRNLRDKASYTDVTLACNGKFYPVHRLVLSTCSEYFSDIFEQTSCKNPVVVLKDIDCKNLEYLLDYMYIGEVNVKQNELASLVGAAECLKIKGLAVPEEDSTPKFNTTSKRQSLECHSGLSPPAKKKRISKTVLDLLVDKTSENHKDSLLTSSKSVNKLNKDDSEFADTFLSIKCEPQSDDDNYLPDFNLKTKTDDITTPVENELEGENEIDGKQENIELPEIDLNQPCLSRQYDHDGLYQPDSDTSTSQLGLPDDAMFKFLISPTIDALEATEFMDQGRKSFPDFSFQATSENSEILNGIEFVIGIESDIKYYQCSLCLYVYEGETEAERHAITHMGDKNFGCQFCPYQAMTSDHLKKHIRIHTGAKPFACNFCPYKATQKEHLKKHIRIHTGERPFSCEYCPYKSTTKESLKIHTRIHTGDKPFSCPLCTYRATTNDHLKKHIRIHTGSKPYSCQLCSYRATTKEHLKKHIRVHTGEKPFSCEFCSYNATTKDSLKIHTRIHTGDKPFSCPLCSYKATTNEHLKKHIRVHTGEKPFGCTLCPYKATTNEHLKKHVLTHSGLKPFCCQFCPYKATQKEHLKRHMRIHIE